MMGAMGAMGQPLRRYATGGTINVDVAPGAAPSANFIGANSPVAAPTAADLAKFPSRAPVTPVAQPAFSPRPFSSSIANVPVGGTSGASTSPYIGAMGANGIPMGSPAAPTTGAPSPLTPAPAPPPVVPGATSADPGQTLAANAAFPGASGLYGVQGGQYFPLNFGTTQQTGVPQDFSSGYGFTTIPSGKSVYTGGVNPGLYNGPVYGYGGNNATPPTLLNPPPAAAKRGGQIKMANGGVPTTPWFARQQSRMALHPEGLIKGFAGGRTDVHKISVPSGSYIMPADVVSGLAEGNTMAGSNVMSKIMSTGPFGMKLSKGNGGMGPPKAHISMPKPVMARGGTAKQDGSGQMVPIIVAGGEHIIYPQTILSKFGNMKKGHEILDKFVTTVRKQTIDEMKKLKGPKK